MHNRDYEWRSLTGTVKVKDIEDLHLANIIHLLKFNRIKNLKNKLKDPEILTDWQLDSIRYSLSETLKIYDIMRKEFKYRKLDKSLILLAPHPFKDKDGLLKKWNYETNSLKVISSAKRFIKDED